MSDSNKVNANAVRKLKKYKQSKRLKNYKSIIFKQQIKYIRLYCTIINIVYIVLWGFYERRNAVYRINKTNNARL